MSISDLFDSGFKKRNEDHFAAIVRIAMSDEIINDSERAFLDRLARNLNISENDYTQILKDFKTHPINPPTSYDNRLERLFDLTRMVWADHIEGDDQLKMLKKLSIGLGFNPDNVNYIVDKAPNLVHNNISLHDFIEQMKTMNKKVKLINISLTFIYY